MFKGCLSVVFCTAMFGGAITVPNAQTSSPGNIQGGAPRDPTPGISEMLFASNQFPGPILITVLSFRSVPGAGPVDIDYGDVSVFLSTSPRSPDATSANPMSLVFADNMGPDNTLVFSGTNVRLKSPGCSGPGVCPFDLNNFLTTPFFYNPANGNLLLHIVSTGFRDVSGSSALDARMFNGPGVSIAEVAAFGSTTSPVGFFFEPRGLITQFTFTEVPEPASWVVTGVGLSALLWTRQRRRVRRHWTRAPLCVQR